MTAGHGDLTKAELLRQGNGAKSVVISDHSHSNNALVCTNEGFARQTRFRSEASPGQDCLFLRGLQADGAAIEASRIALTGMTDITAVLVNDRKVGSKSWKRLRTRPVLDGLEKLRYFVGAPYAIRADAVHHQPIEAISFS
jgi:hypothetical protein